MLLDREMFLGSFERRYIEVDTPAGTVRLQNLNEGEKSDFEAGRYNSKGELVMSNIRSQRRRLISLTMVDSEGERLLKEPGDCERLKTLDAAVTTKIFGTARVHCGFDDDEGTEKNSDATSEDDSPTD